MSSGTSSDTGILILRLALGVLFLLHGVAKLASGVGGLVGMVEGAGLPGIFAYGVYLGEMLGPLLLIAGWYARVGAGLIVINMLVALALVHTGDLFMLKSTGGYQLELQAMFLFTALALILTGPGRYSVDER